MILTKEKAVTLLRRNLRDTTLTRLIKFIISYNEMDQHNKPPHTDALRRAQPHSGGTKTS